MRCLTGFRCTSSGGYNTTFKIQAEISLWQFTFSHKPSQPLFANVAFKNICSGIFLQIIIKACVTEFSSMLKVPCFPHVLLNTEDECIWSMRFIILWDASNTRHSNNTQTAKVSSCFSVRPAHWLWRLFVWRARSGVKIKLYARKIELVEVNCPALLWAIASDWFDIFLLTNYLFCTLYFFASFISGKFCPFLFFLSLLTGIFPFL